MPRALEAVGADADAWRRSEVGVVVCVAVAMPGR
jgi:hypothetical protein